MTTDNLHYVDVDAPGLRSESLEADEREVVRRIRDRIYGLDDLEDVLALIFEHGRALWPMDRLGLAVFEENGLRLTARHVLAQYEGVRLDESYTEDIERSSLRELLQSGRARIIRSLERYLSEVGRRSPSTRLLLAEGVRSNMTIPLVVDGRVVGVLFFSSRKEDAFLLRHLRLILVLAERIGQIVEKVQQLQELAEVNRAYLEVLGMVSHELKAPVASMVMDAYVLESGALGPLSEAQRERVRSIARKGEFLVDLVREYLDLARVEGPKLRLRPQDDVVLDQVLDSALFLHRTAMEDRRIRAEVELPVQLTPVRCDPNLLLVALSNLVGNAVKYGRDGGLIRLEAIQDEAAFEVVVFNEGQGFEPQERYRLFRRFSRLSSAARIPGTGIGLYTAWRAVRLHGGTMDAHSQPGEWAEFTLHIPQPLPQEAGRR